MDWLDRYRLFLSIRIATWRMMARKRQGWQYHIDHAKAFIRNSMTQCGSSLQPPGQAVVLGSGPGFDLPLEDMSAFFNEVVLVDLYHPLTMRWRARGLGNVRFVTQDVTGVLYDTPRAIRRGEPLPPSRPDPALLADADYVVSLNLLSQLPILPELLLAHFGRAEEPGYMTSLVDDHLTWLLNTPALCAVIFDTERRSQSGVIVEVRDLVNRSSLFSTFETWTWDIEPNAWHTVQASIV